MTHTLITDTSGNRFGCSCGWALTSFDKTMLHMVVVHAQLLVNQLCAEHGVELVPQIIVDASMQKALGRANLARGTIRINPRVFDLQGQFEDTIRHEVAHFYAWFIHGCKDHGLKWQESAVLLGAKPQQYAHMESAKEARVFYRYRYECGRGCVTYSHKPRRLVRCAAHGSHFTMFKN